MRIVNLLVFAVFLMLALTACKAEKTPEELLCEYMSYEPYAVEHYELRTFPDTSIVVYFNREVSEKDWPLHVFHHYQNDTIDSSLIYVEFTFPLRRSRGKVLYYKLPLNEPAIDSLNTFAHREYFNMIIDKYLREGRETELLAVSIRFGNIPAIRFINKNLRSTPGWIFLNFDKEIAETPRQKMCFFEHEKKYLWSYDQLRYYKGKFDSLGRKQGYWRWFYSTGVTMAEGEFRADTLYSRLVIYNFRGMVNDTVLPAELNAWNKRETGIRP